MRPWVRYSVVSFGVLVAIGSFWPTGRGLTGEDLLLTAGGLMIMAVGILLVLRVSENAVSWAVFAVACGFGLMAVADLIPDPAAADLVGGAALFGLVLPGLGVFVPLWFPSGAPPSRRWRWPGWMAVGGATAILGGYALIELVGGEGSGSIEACTSAGTCASLAGMFATLAGVAGALVSFVIRWVRSRGVERIQLRWLVPAFTVLGIGVLAEFGGFQDSVVATVFLTAGLMMVPIAIAVAITRYRLYEIDRIISRTVAYALVVGLLGLVLFALVAGLGAVLGRDNQVVVAISTLAVAALFNPVRRRVQHAVDRRFNRSRYDVERVMTEFAGSLRDRVDPDLVVDGWVGVVAETMQPSAVGVWVR